MAQRPTCLTSKSPHLEIHGHRITYVGPGDTDRDAAVARSDFPIHLTDTVFYYEVKILDQGREGYIAIGYCSMHIASNRLPGWDTHSYGYHGDDGNTFSAGTAVKYGPTFGTGDVIGCGVNCLDNTCFYTKNGTLLSTAFKGMTRAELGTMHAAVGLRTQGEDVEINMGDSPFVFDLDSYTTALRQSVRASISAVDVTNHTWTAGLNRLLIEYLTHHGYGRTAEALATATSTPLTESPAAIQLRASVHAQLMSGNVDAATALLNQHYPGVLESNTRLAARLLCQRFVELIARTSGQMSDGQLDEILECGRQIQARMGDDPTLQDIFGLLAYESPRQSPLAYLLDPARRGPLAQATTHAIFEFQGRQLRTALEQILAQTACCLQTLKEQGAPAVSGLSLETFLPPSS